MLTIYDLKIYFQNLLRPLSNLLAKNNITPNEVTISTTILSLLVGLLIVLFPQLNWPFILLPCFLFIRMALNAIDGMLAKEHNMTSSIGTFLNELGDVFSDIFLYLPFCFVPNISAMLVILVVILAIISEMTGNIALQIGSKRRYEGPMGKSDRAFLFGLMSLLLGFKILPFSWFNIGLVLMGLLLIITIYNRIYNALRDNS